MTKREPLIHSHITDGLENNHPLAWMNVFCIQCMSSWIETGKGNFCFQCFELKETNSMGAMGEEWGLC